MKIDKTKIYLKSEQGQSLIEFTLILPIFLILISFVIDIWRVYDAEILLRSYVSDCTNYYQNVFDPDTVDESYKLQALDQAYDNACVRLNNGTLKKIVSAEVPRTSNNSPIVWDDSQRVETIPFRNTRYEKLYGAQFTIISKYATFSSTYDVEIISPISKIFLGDIVPVEASYIIDVSYNVWR